MSKVSKICITEKSGEKMRSVETIEVVAKKGIIHDRYFSADNDKDVQLTLIESENIDLYNQISNTNISYIDFRRNIITKGIQLNELVGKEISIGEVGIKGHRLCNPCKYLQDMLKQENLVKKLLGIGGLRCEILTNGKIKVNDKIELVKVIV